MNRRLVTLLALAYAALGAGCSTHDRSPGAGMTDPTPAPLNDPQITVLAPELRPWLGFQPAYVRHDGGAPMVIEVPVRNLSEERYLVDYRVIFYDGDGIRIEPIMSWEMVPLYPKQVARLGRRAMSDDAVDYRLEIKWAR